MQDAYVGDIGDFGKITLLQLLVKDTELRLGVLWHFVEKSGHDKAVESGHRQRCAAKPEELTL
jgi:hypothetical protein